MTQVNPQAPIDPELQQKIVTWHDMVLRIADMKPLVEAEKALRAELAEALFPGVVEGTAYAELPAGWKIKGTKKLDRKIDEAALPAVQAKFREMGLNPDPVVAYKPSLVSAIYKTLTAEQAAIFNEALIIKPASPTLELVPPKEQKPATRQAPILEKGQE